MNQKSPTPPLSLKILFQGDSITEAFRKPEELNECFQLGAGYAFLAASRLIWEIPGIRFRFLNRGVSGNTFSALRARWQTDALDHRPDVLTLLAGVNDTLFQVSHRETEEACREVLRLTRHHLPRTQVILFEPFLLPIGGVTQEKVEDLQVRCIVIRAAGADFGISTIPLQPLFQAQVNRHSGIELSYDGIHASPGGAVLLANAWMDAVLPLVRS